MRVLLVDILCRESVRKVNALLKQHALTHIYFVNCARNFSQTDLSRLRKKISVPLEQLDQIVEGEARVRELAQMMSGKKETEASLKHAEEMLEKADTAGKGKVAS